MAPTGRRRKVGLTRMDAALDAMKPMEFPTDVVRRSLKKLLKVYGDDGWAFIEEAAYKLLIDTVLEDQEELQHDHEPKTLQLGGGGVGSSDQQELVHQLCDKEVVSEEHKQIGPSSDSRETETRSEYVSIGLENNHQQDLVILKTEHNENVNIGHEKSQNQDLAIVEVTPNTPMPLKAIDNGGRQVGVQLGFAPSYTPQAKDCTPTNRRSQPCFGWISDDDEDVDGDGDFVQLIPTTNIDN